MFYEDEKDKVLKRSQLVAYEPTAASLNTFKEQTDTIIAVLKSMETLPSTEHWYVERDGQTLHGDVCVRGITLDGAQFNDETHLTIYYRSSYNSRFAPGFACGAQVDILGENYRFFYGSCNLQKRRQTSNFILQDFIEEGVTCAVQAAFKFQALMDTLAKAPCNKFIILGILGVMAEQGIFPKRYIWQMYETWNTIALKPSVLDLYKAFEIAYEHLPLEEQWRMICQTTPIVCEALGVTL
jgi:hypothetical protein